MRQISPGIVLIGFFAVLIGLAGAYFVKRSLSVPPTTSVVQPKAAATTVVLASIDLPIGRVIHSGDMMNVSLAPAQLASRKWPAVMLNDGKQILGRIIQRPLKAGEPFEPDSFFPEGTGPGIADRIDAGLRAVTVTVSESVSFPMQVVPGSLVDVIFRSTANEKSGIPEVTRVLLEGVEILAIGSNATPGLQGGDDVKGESTAITLAVTAEQATKLKVVEGRGELSLMLRRPEDREVAVSASSLTLEQILNLPSVVPPPPPFVATIYRRGVRQTVTFGPDGILTDTRFGNIPANPLVPRLPVEPVPAAPADSVPPGTPSVVPPVTPPVLKPGVKDRDDASPPDRTRPIQVFDALSVTQLGQSADFASERPRPMAWRSE